MSTMSEALAHSRKKGWLQKKDKHKRTSPTPSPILVPIVPTAPAMEYLEMEPRREPPVQAAMDEFIPGVIRRSMTPEWMKRVSTPHPLAAAMTLTPTSSPVSEDSNAVAVTVSEVQEGDSVKADAGEHTRRDLEAQKALPPRLEDAAFVPAHVGSTAPVLVAAPSKSWLSWLFRY